MKTTFETKDTAIEKPIDVDLKGGKVVVAGSTMGIEDLDKDIIREDAWDKTIQERGPEGSKLVAKLVDHNPSVLTMYGKPSELYVKNNQLVAVTPVLKTTLGNDILKMYEAGVLNQQSVGFSTLLDEVDRNTGIRVIKQAKLYEISAVLWGANPITPMLDIIKGMEPEYALKTLKTREDVFIKEVKNGSYSDETFILLELQLKHIQQAIADFCAKTKPVENKNLETQIQKFLSSTSK